MNKLVNIDQVTAVVGPVCSAAAGPALPIAQWESVPVIVWGSAPSLAKVGDYIFRTYPSDSAQGVFAADFVYNELGRRKAVVIYVNNDWGVGLNDVFTARFTELGGEVALNEGVAQDATDMRSILTKAKAENPDVIYAPWYPQVASIGVRQARELGIDAQIVAGDAFLSDETLSVPESEGVFITQSSTNLPDDFVGKVIEMTGTEPNLFTPFAYDSIHILATVMAENGTERIAIRDGLANLSYDRSVATGQVDFDEDGDIEFSEFDVMVVSEGQPVDYNN